MQSVRHSNEHVQAYKGQQYRAHGGALATSTPEAKREKSSLDMWKRT